jgi:CheY-like chemotaxis protein
VKEALAQAEAHDFEVLVSDLGLPDGHGSTLMEELKRRRPALTGIAISGFGMEEDLERSRAAGFTEHLTKPVGTQRLQAVIEAIARVRSLDGVS